MRCTGRSTHPEQYSGEVAMHLARGDQPIRSGVFPGKADLADEWAGQPQLPAGAGDQLLLGLDLRVVCRDLVEDVVPKDLLMPMRAYVRAGGSPDTVTLTGPAT